MTVSIMASEIHALVLGFDFSYIICDLVREILGNAVPLEAFVDSKSAFYIVSKDDITCECHLQIYISSILKSYARGELAPIGSLPCNINPSDALTNQTFKIRSISYGKLWPPIDYLYIRWVGHLLLLLKEERCNVKLRCVLRAQARGGEREWKSKSGNSKGVGTR